MKKTISLNIVMQNAFNDWSKNTGSTSITSFLGYLYDANIKYEAKYQKQTKDLHEALKRLEFLETNIAELQPLVTLLNVVPTAQFEVSSKKIINYFKDKELSIK